MTMWHLTISATGQTTFNKKLLTHLGAKPGDKLVVRPAFDGGVTVCVESQTVPLKALRGCVDIDIHSTRDDPAKQIGVRFREGW